jgi:tetrahydromethanopterin S-methyltransferase subunit G
MRLLAAVARESQKLELNMKRIIASLLFLLVSLAMTHAEEALTLDAALRFGVDELNSRLPEGTRIAILNFQSEYKDVSEYIIDELTKYVVNDGQFTAVDRRDLDLLQDEVNFQLSGEVSDESAQSIGKKLGAQTVILGSFVPFGNMWRMRIKALEVETARVQGISTYTVKNDFLLASLFPRQPKTIPDKIGTGSLNIVFGLGSWLEGDISGGLTLTAGYAVAAGLFAVEAAALDWDSPVVGVPATIGFSVAGLTLAYGFVRPFIYNRSPKVASLLDNMKIEAAPVAWNENNSYYETKFRLSYSFSLR